MSALPISARRHELPVVSPIFGDTAIVTTGVFASPTYCSQSWLCLVSEYA